MLAHSGGNEGLIVVVYSTAHPFGAVTKAELQTFEERIITYTPITITTTTYSLYAHTH